MQSKYENNDTLNQILEFNKKSNSYEYGIVVNGRLDTELNDFVNNYHLSDPKSFIKYGGGVCWDWTSYEAYVFRKYFPSIPFNTYYIVCDDGNMCPTHTFLTFQLNGDIYYFESAFYQYRGVYKANSLSDIFNFVITNMAVHYRKNDNLRLLKYPFYIIKYNATNPRIFGMDVEQFMQWCFNQTHVNHQYSPHFNMPVKIK